MSSLFTSLGLAGSALDATGTALRTVGQNIANAETEGYSRQRVELRARRPDDRVHIQVGTGVEVSRIARMVDQHLEEMLRDARASLGDLAARDRILGRVEALLGELDGDSVGGAISKFFDAAEDLVNSPTDAATRTLFVTRAEELSQVFQSRDGGLLGLRKDLEGDVRASVEEMNRLTAEIAQLNREIATREGGGTDLGAANDLRDQRENLVKRLADIVNVRTIETSSGVLNVLVGSDYLVLGGDAKALALDTTTDGEVATSVVRFASDGAALTPRSGSLKGLLDLRDEVVPRIRGDLDTLARAVIGEVNRVHSQGEALVHVSAVTGETALDSASVPLSALNLVPPVRNGSFELKLVNANTSAVETFVIDVDLDGLNGDDTTLQLLAARITQAAGVRHPSVAARVTLDHRLQIETGDPALSFWFTNDSSGALSALGIGTLFTGRRAADIAVSATVAADPRRVATGRGAGSTDATGIQAIAGLRETALLQDGGATLSEFYRGMVGALGVDRARARDLLQNQQAVTDHLVNERSAISGVNLDEESIALIKHQRAYQSAARFLSVVDSLLEALLNA